MKNQIDYFDKVIRIIKELKKDHPDVDISKHYMLATSESNGSFMTDKELYHSLQKHKTELDINTLSDKDLEKIISDTDVLFQEKDYAFPDDEEIEEEEY
jgi:DNA-binding SARP family transcriptional activator